MKKIIIQKDLLRLLAIVLLASLLLGASTKLLALTAANTLINNQATATYTDAGNVARTVSSNIVQTTVQQVAGLSLTASQNKPGSAGKTIVFPHVITNTGNGIDTYNLVVTDLFGGTGIDYAFTGIRILPDVDGNGVADSITPITQSPALDAGEAFSFVIEVDVPSSATDTNVGSLTISAESTFDATQTISNTDIVTVTDRAIIEVIKSLSENSGEAGSGVYTVNLIYNNPSNKIATNVTIMDDLPTGMLYVGNAKWSIGDASLTDSNMEAQSLAPSITYCAYDVTCNIAPFGAGKVAFVIDEVGAGQSGSVSFEVEISASAQPSLIFNVARYQYNDGVGVTALSDSNAAPFEILPTVAVDIVGDTAINIQPGQTANFTNQITNNGNAVDTFNITIDKPTSNFPAGTVFVLYLADGFTPLTDTNNDGLPDTGPLNPAESVQIILKAILPATAPANTYSINKTATSENNPSVSDTDADTVTVAVLSLGADLTNNFPRGDGNCDTVADSCGFGAGPAASAQTILPVQPNASGTFILYVNNLTAVADNFNLEASTDPAFSTISLPIGWSVIFIDDAGQIITNTGPIASGASMRVRAIVSVPAGYNAGELSIYFRVQSPLSGITDSKHDSVDVEEIEDISLTPNNQGQTNPGSFINYTHVLSNNGNIAETNIALAVVNSLAGDNWTVQLYEDTNDNGSFDPGDNQINSIATLTPGQEVTLFTRIFVPTTAADGVSNTTTLTATYNSGADSLTVTDVTIANRFNVDVVKRQSLDSDCNGEADGGSASFTDSTFFVQPGQCLVYEVAAQNNSVESVLNVQIYDATPAYTMYSSNQPSIRCVPAVCTLVTEPASNANGTVHAEAGTVAPGTSVKLYFNVRLEE